MARKLPNLEQQAFLECLGGTGWMPPSSACSEGFSPLEPRLQLELPDLGREEPPGQWVAGWSQNDPEDD